MALPRVTGPDAEQRLKTVVQRNLEFAGRRAQGHRRRRIAVQGTDRGTFAAGAREHDERRAGARTGAPPESGSGYRGWILALLGAAVLLLGALVWLFRKSVTARRSTELRVRENERNQEAIMRLLDELSSLADGDLTVQATVTEDITGAIADSINYAIEALRELVTTINDSAIQLDGAARQTQSAAAHMAKASSAQSRQISAASRIDGRHGGLDRGSLGEFRALLGRCAPFGGHRPQGRRCRAPDHRRHECDSRDHPGDQQAHQAARRKLAGDRQHRRADQRYRGADQHPGA